MHNTLTLPLLIFFRATYYTGLTPFKIVVEKNNDFVIKSWLPQKIVCGILTVLSITPHASHLIWFTTKKKSDWSPPLYFRFFTFLSRLSWYYITHKLVWLQSEKFLCILKFISESNFLRKINFRRKYIKTFVYSCILTYTVAGLLETSGMLNDFDLEKPNQFIDFAESSLFSIIFQISAFVYGCVAGFYWQLLQLLCVLTLWLPCKEFANILDEQNVKNTIGIKWRTESWLLSLEDSPQWRLINEKYKSLKELSRLINDAIGGMIFSYTAYALCTYSYLLDSVFLTIMVTDRWRLITRFVNVILTYGFAADICRQVEKLKEWVNSDVTNVSSKTPYFRISNLRSHRMNILFHELCNERAVAIRGSLGFTLTYFVCCNVCSCIMTFFTICVQFRFDTEKRTVVTSPIAIRA